MRAGYWEGTFDYIGDFIFVAIGASTLTLATIFALSFALIIIRRFIVDSLTKIEMNQVKKETLDNINKTSLSNILRRANLMRIRIIYDRTIKSVWAYEREGRNMSEDYQLGFHAAQNKFDSLNERAGKQFKDIIKRSTIKKFKIIDRSNLRPDQKRELYQKLI